MGKFELIDGEEERQFYKDVHDILENARSNAYVMANDIMTYAYWNVGKRIVEQELRGSAKAKYGSYIIKRLAQDLEDPKIKYIFDKGKSDAHYWVRMVAERPFKESR